MASTKRGLLILLALALSGSVHPLLAQRGRGGVGLGLNGLGPRLGENIEIALANQAQLGLSPDQVASLQDLQAGIQRDVVPLENEMDNVRAAILSGEANQLQGITSLDEIWLAYDEAAAPYRAGIASVLTTAQHASLQQMMFSTRPVWGLGYGAAGVGRGVGVATGVAPRLGLGRSTVWGRGAGLGRGLGLRAGVGYGLGRGAAVGFGRGLGRVGGRGLGRGIIRSPR